jgi:hypothetical protein
MGAVDPGGGAVCLANGMGVAGLAQPSDIGRVNIRRKYFRRRTPSAQRMVDHRLGAGLRKFFGGAARAAPATTTANSRARTCIGVLPHRFRRQDVEHGEPLDALGMIQRHAIGDAAAAIMVGDAEAQKIQAAASPRSCPAPCPLGIGRMVGS